MTGSSPKKILFYVQHLLGVGHVFRARRLCQGFARAGFSTEIIFGGETLTNMELDAEKIHYLPPVKAGAIDYSSNVDGDGNPLTDEYMAQRQNRLLEIFDRTAPDLILFEAWPFGRRFFRHEITALLAEAIKRTRPPLVVTSVRDILQESRKAGRNEEVVAMIDEHVDAVLVHSDPNLITLKDTFPRTGSIENKLHYTGFVRAEPASGCQEVEKFDVIVTIGGGAFGAGLIETALKARALSALKDADWCLCTGPNLPQEVVERLVRSCPEGVTIKTFLPNLAQHLEQAQLSISQVGYNTTMDVLAAGEHGGCRAVLVPSDIAGQTEQLRRSELLHNKGLAVNLPESRLDPASLANAIDEAMTLASKPTNIDFSGVEKSTKLIKTLLVERG